MEQGERVADLYSARQGDVVALSWIPSVRDESLTELLTPSGVVILSQTCDVVRDPRSRPNVLVAPILGDPTKQQLSDARRGRAPLLLYLPPVSDAAEKVADLQHASSVPKSFLLGKVLLSRHTTADSAADAAHLGSRIGRTYARFAFPDEIHEVADALAKKARETSGSSKPFGRVIDYVEDLRLKANHWDAPERILTFYAIVPKNILIDSEDVDPGWTWSTDTVPGARPGEDILRAPLARVSELLANACDSYFNDPRSANMTTLFHLWNAWAVRTCEELLDPHIGVEISEIHFILESDDQFSLARLRRTASLDLEDLSESHGAATTLEDLAPDAESNQG